MAVDFENLSDNARFLLEGELGKAPDQRNPKYAKVTEEYSDFKSQRATEQEQARPLLSRAASNFLPSAGRFASDIASLLNIPRTVSSLYNLSEGIVSTFIPGEQRNEQLVRDVAEFFKDRYGSGEKFRETFATDPVGVVGDLSLLLGGSGAALRSSAVTRGLGEGVGFASAITDPTRAITKPISLATKAGGKGAAEILGVTTGAKKEAIQILANPNTTKAAKDAMRGRFTDADIIKLAEGQFAQLKKARNDKFKADTKNFDLKTVKVEPNLADNLLNITDDIRTDRGTSLLTKSEDKILKTIEKDALGKLRTSDVTLEELIGARRELDDIIKSTEKGTTEFATASEIRAAFKDAIEEVAPEYATIFEEYSEASKILDDITKELKIGGTALDSTKLNKLDATLRAGTQIGEEILETLPDGGLLREILAGRRLNPFIAQDFLRGVAVGGIGTTQGAGAAVGGFGLVSPRIIGEATAGIGGIRRFANQPRRTLGGRNIKQLGTPVRQTLIAGRPIGTLEREGIL